jgi:hypothetical protein
MLTSYVLWRLLQRTKSEFPNMIFKTISADHTACNPANLLVKEQCLPTEQGEQQMQLKWIGRHELPIWQPFGELCNALPSRMNE